MGVFINNIDGTFILLEDAHCLLLDDGRNFLYYYNRDEGKLHWDDLYIINDKYYKTHESLINDLNDFRRLLSKNITKSKPLSGVIKEVSYEDIKEMVSFGNIDLELPNLSEVSNKFPELPIVSDEEEVEHNDNLSVIAMCEEDKDNLLLKLYTCKGNYENYEQFIDEDYGRYKYYYDVKYVGVVKLSDKKIDDLVLEMLLLDNDGNFLKFKNITDVNKNKYFVIDDILLNYSTQSHRCEDKRIVVRDFIADDYISNNNGNESYKHYSNGSRSNFIGLKRTVFHRNLYEINRDYDENRGRSR